MTHSLLHLARPRRLLVTLAAGLLALSPALAADTFNFYVYSPVTTSPTVQGQTAMVNQIEKDTNGQLTIKLHLGGSLPIAATNIASSVADNVVQLGDDTFMTGMIPIAEALRLPRLYRTHQEVAVALKIMDPYMRRAYEKRGALLLAGYIYPEQVIWSKPKITSLADLRNKKIRVTAPSQGVFLRMFGASPVTLGTAEVAAALERSVIEGVVTASSGAAFIFKDLLKYNYRLNLGYGQSYLIVNKEAFQKLPVATQAILRSNAEKAYKAIDDTLMAEDSAMTEKLKAGGIIVTAASAAEEAEAERQARTYWDEWAKKTGPEAVELLKKIRDALGR